MTIICYAFRGASPEFLQRAATELVNAQQMLLTRNFRSDFKIVSHASEMLAFMTDRVDKPLCAVSPAAGYCAGLVFASAEAGSSGFIGIVERICRDRPSTTVGILARTRAQLYPIWSAIKRCDFAGGVELRTYHESKGKEWDVVLLMNSVEEQRGLSEVDEEDAERRLHYVALTRAKHVLIIVLYGPQREPLNRFFVEAGLTAESWSDEKLTDILLALERTS